MSVTKTNDPINDLLAAADTARKARDADKSSDTRDGATPAEEPTTAQFSRLLKERLTGNIVFTRLDQQLDLPQRVVSERASAPVVDRRDELDSRDDVDPFDATDSLEQPAAAPVDTAADRGRVDPVRADATPRAEAAPARNDAGSNGQGAANQGDERGQSQANAAADAARKGAANQANQAVQRTQSGDGLVTEDAAPELAALVTRQTKSDSAKITATVTQEQARVASQPQAALAARAAVDASASNRSGTTPDAALTASDADILMAEGEGNVTSIFERVRAASAAGAKGQSAANANTPDGGDAGKAAQAAQTTQQQPQQVGPALHRAAAAGPAGAASGATQAGITVVDGATGGTASLGENNSIQQRSAPAPTQAAHRPAPFPPGMLADQVAVNIQKGIAQGQDKITVQLRPQELGRVEIKLEMNHDGKMTAVVAAEKPETLDMLRQDARSLIDSLNQAGMKMDESGLNFTLQDGRNGGGGDDATARSGSDGGKAQGEEDALLETGFHFEETGGFEADGRLDVRI
jgi:flagellar hook-length control protein FliK